MSKMRLIDANALSRHVATMEGNGEHVIVVLNSDIVAAPTVDAEPVRSGQWIKHAEYAVCSKCRNKCWSDNVLNYNFCPNCGAKMEDGESDA